MARKYRIARLRQDEDILYSTEWEYYMNNVQADENLADEHAWKVLQREFPRLQNYDGAQP